VDCPDEDDYDAVCAQISCIGHKFGRKDEDGEEYWKEIEDFLWLDVLPERCLMDEKERRRFLGKCGRYFIDDDRLWLKGKNGHLPRAVILDVDGQKERIHEAHTHCGHRGRDPTYEHLCDRYWWPNMYDMVAYHTRQCSHCQHNARLKPIVPYDNPSVPTILRHFHLRIIRMPDGFGGKRYIVQAIDSLSGWPEAEALALSSVWNTAKFIYRHIISRFSCIPLFTVEHGFEFADVEEVLRQKFGVVVVFSSSHPPDENRAVMRTQRVLVDGLLKACERDRTKWPLYLDAVLWAIRATTSRTTGYSPCFMIYGTDFIFSFDHDDATWQILEWDKIQDTPSLIGIRARQIARRDEVALQCSYHPRATRSRAIEDFHVIFRSELTFTDFEVGMWILRNDEGDTWRWSGPFIIHEKHLLDDGYVLRELDGTVIRGHVSVHRLKLFYHRADRHILRSVSSSHFDFVTRFPEERMEELRVFDDRYVEHASLDALCDGRIGHLLPIVTDVVGNIHYPTNFDLRAPEYFDDSAESDNNGAINYAR
jgi:Integrase zinc binding domain